MKLVLFTSALSIAACSTIGSAQAAPVLSSSAYAASVHLMAASVVKADALLGSAAGSGPPAYDDNGDLAKIDQSVVLVAPAAGNLFTTGKETLKTGLVTTSAYAGASSATGMTQIDKATLSLGTTALKILTSLGISADTIKSTTNAGFDTSGVYANGSSSVEGLSVGGSVLGALTINGALFSSANPNTVLLDNLGVLVTLNEQGKTQDANSASMFTNAIHVSLNDFLLDGKVFSGDIILGHSQASITGFVPSVPTGPTAGVPEPATWAMLIVGFGMIGTAMRGRRRRALPLRA